MSSPRPIDFAALLILSCIWSSSFLVIKVAVQELPPLTLVAIRLTLAFALLLLVLMISRPTIRIDTRTLTDFLVIGVMSNVVPFTLIHWGELTITSSETAILLGINPVMTMLLAHYFSRAERLNATRVAGIAIGFVGLLLLVGESALAGLGQHLAAELAIVGGAASYALSAVYIRRRVQTSGTLMATGSLGVGALFVIPLALAIDHPWDLTPSITAITAALVLGLLCTGVAALIYFFLIRNVGATFYSQVNYFIPVLGSLWGWALLGESLNPNAWLALACIIAGVALVNRRST